jgi:hypothetical protein
MNESLLGPKRGFASRGGTTSRKMAFWQIIITIASELIHLLLFQHHLLQKAKRHHRLDVFEGAACRDRLEGRRARKSGAEPNHPTAALPVRQHSVCSRP